MSRATCNLCVKGISIEEVPRVEGPLALGDSLRGDEARRLPRRGYASNGTQSMFVSGCWLLTLGS